MIEAVYISDTNASLVFEYQQRLSSPGYTSIKSMVLAHPESEPPIIAINHDYYVAFERFASITISVLCGSKSDPVNPMIPFVFIHRLFTAIKEYFGTPVSPTKIEANSDTLTSIMAEMIDQTGYPLTTDANQLRDLIPYESFLSKLLSTSSSIVAEHPAAKLAFNQSPPPPSQPNQVSAYPWRRSNVRYTHNEMYIDVIESIAAMYQVVPPLSSSSSSSSSMARLYPVSAHIDGSIAFVSHLTGEPRLEMSFNHVASRIQLPSFHPCIDIAKWDKQCVLNFVPPDGQSTLMEYQLEAPNHESGAIDINYQPSTATGEFELKLQIKPTPGLTKVDTITIDIICAEEMAIKPSRCTSGDFSYKGNGKGEWTLRDVKPTALPLLQAAVINTETDARGEPLYLRISYQHKGCVPSGLKIDSIRMVSHKGMPDSVKPYKGVKYITQTSDIVIRP
ncbi:hypothetical protein DIURU_001849 [Diutina rugosa]|uniref:MHD domain-containing protein n=1 Tax=Diutina rugosa TaxID=5481 RepID=A0A642UZG8_DIURU|nr:uncharacterized protein DIURU_001849 [Diutina rugosa]KAA8904773.1 hypothetical protein DIURU_001849 [Diutina rugosa]